ncbi:MAG TPA: serine/threonine-protein kinase [Polyangiaceae bacterium]|nr:serine/threonine-protein kinase [Polyangiaceae bacterium]
MCPRDGNQLVDSGQDDLLGRTIGNYRVARLLGKGGMGVVYLGVQADIGSRVAIKVINHAGARDGSDVQRFFAEARSVNMIRHPGIVSVLDLAYLPDGRPYIVMEHIDGASLAQWMRSGVGARRLLALGIEILEALAAAHAGGIVHRDLKPDNVMVTPEGRVKLLDFGIAKLRVEGEPTQHLTNTGAVIGTPTYMSPEQALSRPADGRSDLYSFGILLYQGLAGHVPFRGNSLFELLQQHVSMPAPTLTRPDLPEALARLLARILSKDPAGRPQSALELRAELLALLPHVPDNPPPATHAGASYPPAADTSLGGSTQWPLVQRHHAQETNSFGLGGPPSHPGLAAPAHVAGRPSIPAHASVAPQQGSLGTPWILIGVAGVMLLVLAGLVITIVALVVAEQPASSTQPPVIVVAAPGAPPTPAVPEISGIPSASLQAEAQQPERTAAVVSPRAIAAPAQQTAAAQQGAPPAPAGTPAKQEPPTEESTFVDPLAKVKAARLAPGNVKIESRPTGASITFDGRSVGKAPLDLGKVEQGSYFVVCTLAGHKSRTFTVKVSFGSTTVICDLDPEPKK